MAATLKTPRSFAPFMCGIRNNASYVCSTEALAVGVEPLNHSPKHQPTVQLYDPAVSLLLRLMPNTMFKAQRTGKHY